MTYFRKLLYRGSFNKTEQMCKEWWKEHLSSAGVCVGGGGAGWEGVWCVLLLLVLATHFMLPVLSLPRSVFWQSARVCRGLEMFTEERCSCHVLCKLVLFSSVSHRLHVIWALYKEQLNCYFEPFLLSVGSPQLGGYINFCFRTKWTPQTGKLCQYLKGEA